MQIINKILVLSLAMLSFTLISFAQTTCKDLFSAQKYDETVKTCTADISTNPQDARAFYYRAKALYSLGKIKEALADAKKAASISEAIEAQEKTGSQNRIISAAYFVVGTIQYYELNQKNEAIESFSKSIKGNPANSDSYLQRGIVNLNDEKFQIAMPDFEKVLELSPTEKVHHYIAFASALAYQKSGKTSDLSSIKTHILTAIQQEPEIVTGKIYEFIVDNFKKLIPSLPRKSKTLDYQVLRRELESLGEFETALAVEEKANQKNQKLTLNSSDSYETLIKECQTSFEKRDFPGTIQICTKALEAKSDSADAFYFRGLAYYQTPDPKPQSNLDALVTSRGVNFRKAGADFAKCTQLVPDSARCFYSLGAAQLEYLQREQMDEAVKSFSEAIRLKTDAQNVFYLRGEAYRKYNNPSDLLRGKGSEIKQRKEFAIADYTKDIELNPSKVRSFLGRGIVSVELEKYDFAIADLTKFINQVSFNGEALYWRGEAYRKLKDYGKAIDNFDEAVKSTEDSFLLSKIKAGGKSACSSFSPIPGEFAFVCANNFR